MTISFTPHTLSKLEQLIEAIGYRIRYEKGNFKTGACILEHSQMIVVNKFSDLNGKITALIELIPLLEVDPMQLDVKQQKLLDEIQIKNQTL